MNLGEKIKQARLEAGLSQRQLCGERITRNMLSQIENGAARPSMDTLIYLAQQLGRPVSWFLEEQTAPPSNPQTLERTLLSYRKGDYAKAAAAWAQEHQKDAMYYYLQGRAAQGRGEYALAAEYYRQAEALFPKECAAALEACYRELEDYKMAYHYACKQR